MTPAERVAKTKKPREPGRVRPVRWVCRVRELRDGLGLTQRDVEAASGVNSATLSHVEAGHDVTLRNALALAAFFGVPVEHLWKPVGGKTK